ncbi:MAG: dipeptidase [Phycisphaeraceae bacterium]|nr:dipeptidase [Phycisphaeraceae bacterium]
MPVSHAQSLDAVRARIDAGLDASVDALLELLRIPSVSTDPAYRGETARAAMWVAARLAAAGFTAEAVPTPGHPIVLATHPGPRGAPHLLYYGHYDVQPADPLDLWTSPPFEPVIVDGPHGPRIVARGACDDKGQIMTFIEALAAWRAEHGSLPARVTVLIEGEEESGGPSLGPFLEAHREALRADVCIISDTGMWDVDTPAITTMLRGLLYIEATLHGPSHDLHSGMYGGAVVNPNNALARILGELHDADRRVAIPGFYDQVREPDERQKAQWEALGFDDAAFLASAGLTVGMGERGRSVLERTWSRPTCDVNGMWGGYTGAGAKTVIPAQASAKISCRLVADQDPKVIEKALLGFLDARTPPGCRWTFRHFGGEAAVRVASDSPWIAAASGALEAVYGSPARLIGTGGSIPVVGSLKRLLGIETLLVGFGLDDDRVHSPNEKFERICFERGIHAHAALLAALAAPMSDRAT